MSDQNAEYVRITADQRAAMDAHLGGGFIGYLGRIRNGHRPTFVQGRHVEIVYAGCSCGNIACQLPRLLVHIEDLKAAYQSKVDDLAAETIRSAHIDSSESS